MADLFGIGDLGRDILDPGKQGLGESQLNRETVFIGIPDLARKISRSRQDTHYRARNGLLPIRAYVLRRNRQLTYIFDESEVDEYVRKRNEAKAITQGESNA